MERNVVMTRDNFLFKDSSRIYKQANELARGLRCSISGDSEWFSDAAQLLASHGLLALQNDEQWLRAIEYTKQRLDSIACTIDTRIAIPALLEAVDDFYYRDTNWKKEVPICGSAMKTSIAMIWPNRQAQTAVDKSAAQLQKLVFAAMAWEQLVASYEHHKVFRFESVEFHPRGFSHSSERYKVLLAQWNAMASPYGETQRTLEHSKSVIFENPRAFSDAVTRVLEGEKSSDIELFAGTVFAQAGEKPAFWLGLKARLTVLQFALQFKLAGAEVYSGVVLFEEFAAEITGFGLQVASVQASVEACFWQADWYPKRRMKDFPSNMLVERPVLRIDNKTFATTVLTIIDSINCFVENSVFDCADYGGSPVHPSAFQMHISQPFEQAAVDLCLKIGWKAGVVSDKGYWAAGNCQLVHPNGKKVPGEIDVLALHPSGLLALILECKVLTQPFSKSKLTNVVGKLGPDDQENFHSKLERKVNWLSDVPALKGAEVVGALLVDQGSFLGRGAPHPVVDLEQLTDLLEFFNKQINSDIGE
ncbi:hypothetical protein KVG95_22220 [Pseudomonas sp. SWRI79]|uniref:Uncharacterized protein n=1 Tax=Pseudomonas farris TaxID=2841207 RepID=A0ABS6PZY9_9PSED|nr:hypothetical protein [Pseudomonas farris]MBV4466038.1 hypothetical protein [Pseudomonas farris]